MSPPFSPLPVILCPLFAGHCVGSGRRVRSSLWHKVGRVGWPRPWLLTSRLWAPSSRLVIIGSSSRIRSTGSRCQALLLGSRRTPSFWDRDLKVFGSGSNIGGLVMPVRPSLWWTSTVRGELSPPCTGGFDGGSVRSRPPVEALAPRVWCTLPSGAPPTPATWRCFGVLTLRPSSLPHAPLGCCAT